jgi:hypothetical protein
MAYSKSRRTIERNRQMLEELYRHRRTVRWRTHEPAKLAYRLREAINASIHHDDTRHFASLKPLYEFRVKPNEVEAAYLGNYTEGAHRPADIPEQTEPLSKKAEVDIAISTPHGIVGAMIDHPTTDEVYFPNVALTQSDLHALHRWTSTNGYQIIDHEGAGLTITKLDVPEELIWHPSEKET